MRNIVRGQTVQWAAYFFDFSGAPTNPLNSFVDIEYYNTSTTQVTISLSMTQGTSESSNQWAVVWDSSQAVAGQNSTVSWHLRSLAAAGIKSAYDGNFMLTANVSNTA